MSQKINQCLDGHRCENGSICIENSYDEGNFYCDCDSADIPSVFEGLYCEHEATEFCSDDGGLSKVSFCTNHGRCKKTVGYDDQHPGCICPSGYEGEHCQFVRGTMPKDWRTTSAPAKALIPERSGGSHVIGSFMAIAIVVGSGIIIYQRKRFWTEDTASKKTKEIPFADVARECGTRDDLTLEADGSSTLSSFVEGNNLPSPEDLVDLTDKEKFADMMDKNSVEIL